MKNHFSKIALVSFSILLTAFPAFASGPVLSSTDGGVTMVINSPAPVTAIFAVSGGYGSPDGPAYVVGYGTTPLDTDDVTALGGDGEYEVIDDPAGYGSVCLTGSIRSVCEGQAGATFTRFSIVGGLFIIPPTMTMSAFIGPSTGAGSFVENGTAVLADFGPYLLVLFASLLTISIGTALLKKTSRTIVKTIKRKG